MRKPSEADARRVVEETIGVTTTAAKRFTTGHCHYVYDVTLADGRSLVARLASAETRSEMLGGIHWHSRLATLGLPLPKLLRAETTGDFAFMILERLPGRDLGTVYSELTETQKRALALTMADIQARCAQLPAAAGYGYALSYEDPALRKNQHWRDVLVADLERSRHRIQSVGAVDPSIVDHVARELSTFDAYFSKITPTAFLDDTTTRNVLVHRGALTGIVDVDTVCFGDPLLTPALTRMALLAQGSDTRYIDYWLEAIAATTEQRKVVDLYTAIFCANFLSEQGQAFNRDSAHLDRTKITQLLSLLEQLLSAL